MKVLCLLLVLLPVLVPRPLSAQKAPAENASSVAPGVAASALHSLYQSPFAQYAWGHHNLVLENGYTEAMMHQVLRGGFMDDSLTLAQSVPASARNQSNVLSLWQRTFSKTGVVGLYSQCNVAVDGGTCWGFNPVVNDYDIDSSTRAETTLFGMEIDANVQSPTTGGAALFFGALMKAQPRNLGVIHIPAPVSAGQFNYSYGLWLDDGAVQTVGLHLGALKAGGASGSQMLEFKSNGEAAAYSAFLFTDTAGRLHLRSRALEDRGGDLELSSSAIRLSRPDATLELGSASLSSIGSSAPGEAAPAGLGTLQVHAREVQLPSTRATSMAVAQGTPLSSHSACVAGQIWSDDEYVYVCTSTGAIKRAALSAF